MRKSFLILLGMLAFSMQLLAQNKTVSGTVTDSLGQGLQGASVRVPGTTIGTTTNVSGSFTLSVPQSTNSLEVSSVGYITRIFTIPASGNIFIELRQEAGTLNEVIITGINRVKRSQYTGAATKIDQAQIINRPVGSFEQILQGRVPGVLTLTTSGQPGNSSAVIIRGQGSIQGGVSPLYVVDGIPVEAGVFQSLNPNDFESIDILRDASAAALYGSRGSAGVIVVTTKRGQSGKMQLSYSGQYGVKSRPQFSNWEVMNAAELLKAQEDVGKALNLPGNAENLPGWFYSPNNPNYSTLSPAQQAEFDAIYDSLAGINTNWRDVFFREGTFRNNQISISGGTGKTRLYSSIGLYHEEGTTLRTDMTRATLRNNIDYADDRLTLAISSNLGYTKRNFQQTTTNFNTNNPFLGLNLAPPYAAIYNPDGSYATGTGAKYIGTNALELVNLDMNYNNQVKVTVGLTGSYKLTNEFSLGLTTGIDFRETQSTTYGNRLAYLRSSSGTPTTNAGSVGEGLTRFLQASVRPSIGFTKSINAVHDIDVNLYGEYIKEYAKTLNMTGYGIDPRIPNTPAAITQGNASNLLFANVGGSKGEGTLVSGLLIARYTYDGKYTFTGSYRRDGSSKLPVDTRWQGFYSLGAVWEAGREDFMSSSVFNTLRVKLSYGGSGNADNFPGGYYPYQATYGSAGSNNGLPIQVATYPGNPDLKWETTWIANFGIDFGIWRNRVYGDVNFYDKRTKDLFVQKTLSATSGFGAINVNAGELQNKGVELSLNVEAVRNRDLVWTVFGNFALNRNKVLDLGGESEFEQGTELIKVGFPLGSHYSIKWAGVDAATGAPLYWDGNGKLTQDGAAAQPVQEFGTWEAPWRGGFGTSVRYKNFEFSTLFSWQRGGSKYNNLEYFSENPEGFLQYGYNQYRGLDFWKQPGDIVNTPSPLYAMTFSSKFIHKSDFLRWRDLTISYSIPKSVTDRVKFISNARFYVQGNNLIIWTNWKGMDPEAGAVNLNVNEFPNPRAVTAGIDITF